MKLLYITSVTNPEGNGVAVAVENYYKYGSKLADIAVYNMEGDVAIGNKSYSVLEYKKLSDLPNGFNSPDLIIFNELYKPSYLRLYKDCIIKGIPYIIIPHGCLTKQAQSEKRIKKRIANFLFFNRFIKCASAIQYLNNKEQRDSIIKKKLSFVSGNGVVPRKKTNKDTNKDYVYIGRYGVKVKGLDLIIDVVTKNKEWFIKNGVVIQLYGRNSGDGYETLKKIIEDNGISNIVILNNAIYDEEKEKVLLRAYAFIQVSRHEGQPMGIMEALSYGLPCIVTYGTSFGEYINKNNCGIGINFDENELFGAIKKMIEDRDFRDTCAKNAKIIEREYDWEKVIGLCLNKYKELI